MLFRHLQRSLAGYTKSTLKRHLIRFSLRKCFEKSSNALIYGCFSYKPSASSKTAASDASWESSQSGSHATIYPREQLISHKTVPNYASIFESWGSEQGWESVRQPEGTLSIELQCMDPAVPPDLSISPAFTQDKVGN